MAKFHALPVQYQQAILDMHCPPLDREFSTPWKVRSHKIATNSSIAQHELLLKLMLVTEINAHSYGVFGHEAYQETLVLQCRSDSPVALFYGGPRWLMVANPTSRTPPTQRTESSSTK